MTDERDTASDCFDPPEEKAAPPPKPDRNLIEVIDLADLLVRDLPPPWSIVGTGLIIEKGISVGGGAPRVGKSLLCSNLAIARLMGMPWLGFPVQPGRTLYLQAEIPEAWLKLRFAAMVAALADPDVPLVPRGGLFTVTKRGIFLDTEAGRETFPAARGHLGPGRPVPRSHHGGPAGALLQWR